MCRLCYKQTNKQTFFCIKLYAPLFQILGTVNVFDPPKGEATFYCPTGQLELSDGYSLGYDWYYLKCDKFAKCLLSDLKCSWDFHSPYFDCSRATHLHRRGYRPACIIHDMCYRR